MLASVLVAVVAAIHIYIVVLEMLSWDKPAGMRAFDLTPDRAALTRVMAANQGLYNGFLAAGLIWGLDLTDTPVSAARVSRRCFDHGLIVETCGRGDQVLKILPPLTIDRSALLTGLDLIVESVHDVAAGGGLSTTRRTA